VVKTLGELCEFKNGGTPSKTVEEYYNGGTIPWISSADIKDGRVSSPRIFITPKGVKDSSVNVVKKGTVLLVTRTGVGKVVLAPYDLAFSQDITALIPNEDIHAEYLARFLKANAEKLVAAARGATIPGVSRQVVESLRVELPNLGEQRRIADISGRVDVLRQKQAEAQGLAGDLVPAVFEEMFGNPLNASSTMDQISLGDLLSSIDSGMSPVCADQSAEADEWGVLKLSAITLNSYDELKNKAILPSYHPDVSLEVKAGDILFARKNTKVLVGACAYVEKTRPKLLIPDLIFSLRIKDGRKVRPRYLAHLLGSTSFKTKVTALAGGSAGSMPNISKEKLRALLVPVPKIEKQEAFEKKLVEVSKLKETLLRRSKDFEDLSSSLSAQVFDPQ